MIWRGRPGCRAGANPHHQRKARSFRRSDSADGSGLRCPSGNRRLSKNIVARDGSKIAASRGQKAKASRRTPGMPGLLVQVLAGPSRCYAVLQARTRERVERAKRHRALHGYGVSPFKGVTGGVTWVTAGLESVKVRPDLKSGFFVVRNTHRSAYADSPRVALISPDAASGSAQNRH